MTSCVGMSLGGSTRVDQLSPSSLPGSQDMNQDTAAADRYCSRYCQCKYHPVIAFFTELCVLLFDYTLYMSFA